VPSVVEEEPFKYSDAEHTVRAVHVPSVVAVGPRIWYCDEEQAVRAEHMRSSFAVGATDWYCDELQRVQSVHDVPSLVAVAPSNTGGNNMKHF
jgi:hypothetical protein